MFGRSETPSVVSPDTSYAPRIRLDGAVKQVIDRGRNRLVMAGALFCIGFAAIGWRLVDIAVIEGGAEPRLAAAPVAEELRMDRADIVDRNGIMLATSLPTDSLYADPKFVADPEDAARKLVRVLPDLSEAEILARLKSGKRFVWLRRHLTPQQKYAVNRLGIPGFNFQREERRVYPHGPLATHIVGATDVDNRGISGVEKYFDEALAGGRDPLQLSLDLRVQHVVADELQLAMAEFRATAAAGLVLDIATGEVVAMTSLPDYDANAPAAADQDALFNRATLGVYEMGSTFKIFTAAMALESGAATLDTVYDATRPIEMAGFTIADYKGKKRPLSVPEIFIYSSNIGAAKMALEVGLATQTKFLAELDLLTPAKIELPEIGRPLGPARWTELSGITAAFGHGLSVSPLQIAAATGAVVGDGVLRPTTLLKRLDGEMPIGRQVVSPRTVAEMRSLMRLNVTDGTGRRAEAIGYAVGGKTGSAEKVGANGYDSERLLSSFIGAFPMNDPRYVVFVMLDEPLGNDATKNKATGGLVAAPIIRRIVERSAPLLGVLPEAVPVDGDIENQSPYLQQASLKDNGRAAE